MSPATIRPLDVVRAIKTHPWQIAAAVVVFALLAFAYAEARSTTWEASQALVVRDEAGDRLTRPDKFTLADEMKNSQETILALARSRNVLSLALAQIGPPAGDEVDSDWPGQQDVEDLQGKVEITPPKGAEFGRTEVFYLKVQDASQERAIQLALAICWQLQKCFANLREEKARGTIDELSQSVNLAQRDLAEATSALGKIEDSMGSDLAELRMLTELPSADSDLRRMAIELEKELRAYQASQTENEEFLSLLKVAQHDPNKLLASPSVLIKSQPALSRLKDGLIDAQLRAVNALGTISEDHPLAIGARTAERNIREQLHAEISVAIRGVESDLRINADRIRTLEEQRQNIHGRLGRLAAVRAEYANLVTITKNRSEALKAVEHDLAEARGSKIAASAASLINLVDRPDIGSRPLEPSRATIALAGAMGGLLVGVAFVFLTIGPSHFPRIERSWPLPSIERPRSQSFQRVSARTLKQALKRVADTRL